MNDRCKNLLCHLAIAAIALAVSLPTLGWGLPSRASDRYLFGDRTPWTGKAIVALVNGLPLPLAGGGRGEGQSSGAMLASGNSSDRSAVDDASRSIAPPPNPLPQAGGGTMRGADVDADPILDRSKPVILNDTDAKRAAIVQRYRLMSGQPDEFIQFKALAEMSQRSGLSKLDPRLYQYGGLWIYPVGALVRTSMAVGLIERPPKGVPALEFYLDHPEAFGRFYVVARGYSTFWGVVAALAVFGIARRITASRALGVVAAIAFILLPVTRTAMHEAKPHLAGGALCLCAVLAASNFVETGRRRWLIAASTLCGAAMAMVVSMLMSVVVLMAMVWLRYRALRFVPRPGTPGRGQGEGRATKTSSSANEREQIFPASTIAGDSRTTPLSLPSPLSTGERNPFLPARAALVQLAAALAIASLVYAATNPFVLYNAIAQPALLRSNLGNSTAMYGVSGLGASVEGAAAAAIAAFSIGASLIAALAVVVACWRHRRLLSASPTFWILLSLAIAVTLVFVALAAGKPVEYARFGIVPIAAVCVIAPMAWWNVRRPRWPAFVIAVFAIGHIIAMQVVTYVPPVRLDAETLKATLAVASPPNVLQVNWPPAPWSSPPVDLFSTRILLTDLPNEPRGRDCPLSLYPSNLTSQIADGGGQVESLDWMANRFIRFPSTLGTTRRAASH